MVNKELAVVIPVYNEADNLEKLIADWHKVFSENNISYCFILVNDGSKDESKMVIEKLQKEYETITLLNQPNSGHGAAILNGYHKGLLCEWIFQIDSDHQYTTNVFSEMWKYRNDYDFLIAERKDTNASLSRKMITYICSKSVNFIFGSNIIDINSPYRLIKSSLLANCLEKIPVHSFAPNVIMTVLIIKKKEHTYSTSLYFRPSIVPNKSRLNKKLFQGSVQTFFTLFKIRFS